MSTRNHVVVLGRAALLVALGAVAGCDLLTALGGGEGLACRNDEACRLGLLCIGGRCQQPGQCGGDGDCAGSEHCRNGVCVAGTDAGATTDATRADRASADTGAGADARPASDRPAPDTARSDLVAIDLPASDRQTRDAGRSDQAVRSDHPVDAGGSRDAAADAGAPVRCGTVQSLPPLAADGWNWYPYSDPGTTVAVAAGQAAITLEPGAYASAYAGVTSAWRTSLRDRALRVQITDGLADGNGASEFFFDFQPDQDNLVGIGVHGPVLIARHRQGGATMNHEIGTFDPVAHRWWQLRATNDTLYFETSPDGATWTARHIIDTPAFIDGGRVDIVAGTWQDVVTIADTIAFDSLNAGLAGDPWCSAGSLHDDFGDPLGPWWNVSDTAGCAVTTAGGVLNLYAPAVHDSACYVETSQPFALLDSAATARVVNAPTDVGAWTMMSINGPDIWVEYGLGEDRLRVNAFCPGSASHFWIDDAPAAGRNRLRIRHGQGSLLFEAASDGDDIWETVDTTTCAVPATGVTIGLQLTFWLPTAASSTRYHAALDDYNLGP